MSEAPQSTFSPPANTQSGTRTSSRELSLGIPGQSGGTHDSLPIESTSLGIISIAEAPSRRNDRDFVGYLGERFVTSSWKTKFEGQPVRTHQRQKITLPGRVHPVLHTDGIAGGDLVVAGLLGWTQSIYSALATDSHVTLAHHAPYAKIDTYSTYGNDGSLSRRSLREVWRTDWDRITKQTLSTMVSQYDTERILLVGLSMGFGTALRLAYENIQQGEPLNIVGVKSYEGFAVAPERAGIKMAARLFAHIGLNAGYELIFRTDPSQIPETLNRLWHSAPRKRDALIIGRQGLSLMGGLDKHIWQTVCERYPVSIMQGDHDTVREPELENHPKIEVKLVPGKGHAMAGIAEKSGEKQAELVRKSGQYY